MLFLDGMIKMNLTGLIILILQALNLLCWMSSGLMRIY